MSQLLNQPPPAWMQAPVTAAMPPGEVVQCAAEMFSDERANGERVRILVVLTNRNVRFMNFDRRSLLTWNRPRTVVFNYAIPRDEIRGFSVLRKPGLLWKPPLVGFVVSWAQGDEIWMANTMQADQLVRALEIGFNRRHMAGRSGDLADELAKLAKLQHDGVLSADEFARAKALFLGSPPDAQAEAIQHLRELHSLYRSGVLSEGEFNTKKWDILSGPSMRERRS
jgi:hypothetical protein